ncbi:MFS transporter [Micromonospora sp. KC723]|uniref:MFS transporter n=1 Tax=Micromonospora sp. KC723 TaxID=2530381 RepID=UPI0014055FC6|nr:MFS transporter [Micromonospora sp. KC723]
MTSTLADSPLPPCFRWFWTSQTLSFLGDRLTGFTVPSIAILALSASSAEVGVLAATGWLAYPIFGMLVGAVLADRPRRRLIISAELIRFLCFFGVACCALVGWVGIPHLVVAVAVAGVATVVTDIGGQSYLPALVPPEQLLRANARLQSSDSLSRLGGPALAGLLLSVLAPLTALMIDAVAFLLSALGRTPVRTAEIVHRPPRPEPIRRRMRRGIRFVARHALLRQLIGASALRSFGTGAVDAVLLLFAYRGLGLSSVGGGLLLAVGSVGGLIGSWYATRLTARLGSYRTLTLTALEGVSWLAVPLCLVGPPAPVLVAIKMFSSLWMPVWAVLTTSLRQSCTPADQQSGVHATARTLTSSTVPLGSLVGGVGGGVLSAWLGTSVGLVVVLAAGGTCVAGSVLLLRRASLPPLDPAPSTPTTVPGPCRSPPDDSTRDSTQTPSEERACVRRRPGN